MSNRLGPVSTRAERPPRTFGSGLRWTLRPPLRLAPPRVPPGAVGAAPNLLVGLRTAARQRRRDRCANIPRGDWRRLAASSVTVKTLAVACSHGPPAAAPFPPNLGPQTGAELWHFLWHQPYPPQVPRDVPQTIHENTGGKAHFEISPDKGVYYQCGPTPWSLPWSQKAVDQPVRFLLDPSWRDRLLRPRSLINSRSQLSLAGGRRCSWITFAVRGDCSSRNRQT